jgi:hypothetical protein
MLGLLRFFKTMDVSRHHAVDALRGSVRDAELFMTLTRACWKVRADHMRLAERRSCFLSFVQRGEQPFMPIRGLTYRSKPVPIPKPTRVSSVPFCEMGG